MADAAGGIFLSYRRDDAGGYSLPLKKEIARQFPRAPVRGRGFD
jgi:hypothetical protein